MGAYEKGNIEGHPGDAYLKVEGNSLLSTFVGVSSSNQIVDLKIHLS